MLLLKIATSGTMVHKGDVVAEFDPQNMQDHLEDTIDGLQDKVNDVKKKVVQNEVDMVNLEQTLRVAKANVDKARLDMKTTDIRMDIDRELLVLQLEEAEATLKELSTDLPLEKNSQAASLRITEITKKIEDLHVERHQQDIRALVIKAPIDGMVVLQTMYRPGGEQVQLAVGDRAFPGMPIMKVIDPKTMQVEGTINQAEISAFRIGQSAAIGLDAFPGAAFSGKVYAIGALAVSGGRQQYYLRNVPVRVQIENPDKRVIPDLSAAADILLGKQNDVIVAPLSAIEQGPKASYVYLKTPKGFEKREVKLGASNGVEVALLEGAKDGDVIKTN